MQTARVFYVGDEQFVELPPDFWFKSDEVDIFRRGKEIVLIESADRIGIPLEILTEGSDKSERGETPSNPAGA